MVRRRLSGRCRTAYHYRVKAGIMLEAALTAATARSVCGSSPRNGYFRGYHTNTARGESKTPISRNRGEIGGSVREHVPKEPRERNGIIGSELGLWIDRREWRDVPIIETPAHNPKVVGSNPAPATKSSQALRGLFLYSRDVARKQYVAMPEKARRNPNPRRCSKEMSTPIKRQHSLHASAWNRLQDGAWGYNRRYPRAALPDVLREHEGLRYQQGETNDSCIRLPSCDEDRNADYRQHSSR